MNFLEAVEQGKWSKDKQIEVLLTYIERQQSDAAFHNFLEEELGTPMEEWADAIREAVSEFPALNVDDLIAKCNSQSMEERDETEIYKLAAAIVEPNGKSLGTSYQTFMESGNWVAFIKLTYGDAWGKIAQYVHDNGY